MKTSITYKRVLSLVATLLLVALPAMAFAAPELTARGTAALQTDA